MTFTPRVPPALKALRASLRTCTEAPLRDRLVGAITYLTSLYGLPPAPDDDDGDMHRRRFAASSHKLRPRAQMGKL
jgi:hypothetical protein